MQLQLFTDYFLTATNSLKGEGQFFTVPVHENFGPWTEKMWSVYHMKVSKKLHHIAEAEKCPMDGKETAFVVISITFYKVAGT